MAVHGWAKHSTVPTRRQTSNLCTDVGKEQGCAATAQPVSTGTPSGTRGFCRSVCSFLARSPTWRGDRRPRAVKVLQWLHWISDKRILVLKPRSPKSQAHHPRPKPVKPTESCWNVFRAPPKSSGRNWDGDRPQHVTSHPKSSAWVSASCPPLFVLPRGEVRDAQL